MRKPLSLLRLALVALTLVAIVGSASAQPYPNRVIKIVVPFGVGGQPDVIARLFAQHLQATLGTTIIDNRPGNNTIIGVKIRGQRRPRRLHAVVRLGDLARNRPRAHTECRL